MKLKNILLVVKDIQKSIDFYHDLFGLNVILDNDGNVIMSEGLVLQDALIWKEFIKSDCKYVLNRNRDFKCLWGKDE